MTSTPTADERAAFYGAAVLGLRALDARERTARRFGPEAEARWMQLAGALGTGDRLDILLRDAAVTWGAAFSPSECFGFFGLADDEPFGPDWGGIDDPTAKRLLTEANGPVTLDGVASALGVDGAAVSLPPLTPATKLVVAGGAALVALAKTIAADRALSWTDQVAVIADKANFRQLAALAAVLLGARGRTILVRSTADATGVLRRAGFSHIDADVVSLDAERETAALAHGVAGRG
jgi:hypothetical protein